MKKAGLVGSSYEERSIPFDAQRTINLFPVVDETKQGKEVSALYGTPGKLLFATAGTGTVRQEYSATNGRAFVVTGTTLYELDSSGTATSRGTLEAGSGVVTMAENGTQLAICDSTYVYTFTYATNAFAKVTDGDLPSSGTLCFLDGYFIVSKNLSGAFYISSLYDGTAWAALDFATAESSPDNLVRVFPAVGLLWLFGDKTTEMWSNVGGTGFPFARVSGGKIETGCAAAHSVVALDNSVFWVGQDNRGSGIVYRANGFSPQRISTHAIEYKLQRLSSLSVLRAYTYQQDGHTFYVLTDEDTITLVYDIATQLWHERAYLSDGVQEADLGSTCMYAFGKVMVGDRSSANIYQLKLDNYADNTLPILRSRTFTHISNNGEPFRINSLLVDFEYGVGLATGQGSDPQCWLEVSKDGGITWGRKLYASIGAIGQRNVRAIWRKLGNFDRQVTFKVSISDPVKVAICGAYFD